MFAAYVCEKDSSTNTAVYYGYFFSFFFFIQLIKNTAKFYYSFDQRYEESLL